MATPARRTAPRLMFCVGGFLLVGLAVSSCSGGEPAASPPWDEGRTTFAVDTGGLRIDAHDGDVHLVVDDSLDGQVRVSGHPAPDGDTDEDGWYAHGENGDAAAGSDLWDVDGEGRHLTLREDCGEEGRPVCARRHEIAVPADLPVRLEGHNGTVTASGLAGALDLTTLDGPIDVSHVSGPLTLRSHNGTITATDVTAEEIRLDSHDGTITLAAGLPPRLLEAATHNGAVRLDLPEDAAYLVGTDTHQGPLDIDVETGGDEHRVDVRTHDGEITLRGVPSDRETPQGDA
ncbi:DUF4097 family beta strand repeat-containing protein [Streptomyces spiramenti]|uniref:DUF4097 domain-containing protein n=1 Tax=Streptomyces spiramenti TaxID=2720606 RepID=A0ABX1AV11_9ACTN|nr:DUF4097 family beta strand repeat-containing protein [Streptomyces spiramenti]NJP68112.1 DUF4097 domain-containing protein [Streptomyces spiramenti]